LLTPEPGEAVYSQKFEKGPDNFEGGQRAGGGVDDSQAYAFPSQGASVWETYSTPVRESTTIRFKLKPLCDARSATILIWSKKHKDNCRYYVTGLQKDRWRDVEFRAIEARVGWGRKGPSLEGDVLDNIKIMFEGNESDRILLDDFEILE
jgi:hypothetical protein